MPEPAEIEQERVTVEVPANSRQQHGRKPPPPGLPRIEIVHDIDEAEKTCGCGAQLDKIGEDVSEKLSGSPDIPGQVRLQTMRRAGKSAPGR